MEFWAAISIGLLGSLHCVGMCGPIAFALPLNRKSAWSTLGGSLIYNGGRLFTYFSLGLVFGFLGFGFSLAGMQQWISIAVGVLMIGSVVFSQLSVSNQLNLPKFSLWIGKVKAALGKRLGKRSNTNLLGIGMLNGFLPCGLVYMGLAGATAASSVLEGGLFMLYFGLGTIPLMLAVTFYGNQIKFSLMKQGKRLIPAFIILIGSLFILRGLNLGVPYLSPNLNQTEVTECH